MDIVFWQLPFTLPPYDVDHMCDGQVKIKRDSGELNIFRRCLYFHFIMTHNSPPKN